MSESRRGSKNSNFGNRWKQSSELRALHSKLSSGENNGMYGRSHTADSKEKNRNSHIGKKIISNIECDKVKAIYEYELPNYLNNGWIQGNIHLKNKRHQHSIEERIKISNVLKNKPKSEEHKRYLSESRLNKYKNNKL